MRRFALSRFFSHLARGYSSYLSLHRASSPGWAVWVTPVASFLRLRGAPFGGTAAFGLSTPPLQREHPPGAEMERQPVPQITQAGPQWARRERQAGTQAPRAGWECPRPRAARNSGVPGGGRHGGREALPNLPIAHPPWRLFGDFLAGQKVTRRPRCARRRVSERNRRAAAALSAEMRRNPPADKQKINPPLRAEPQKEKQERHFPLQSALRTASPPGGRL